MGVIVDKNPKEEDRSVEPRSENEFNSDQRKTDYYLDNNLDWSFVALSPQLIKILHDDQLNFSKRNDHSLYRHSSRARSSQRNSKRNSSVALFSRSRSSFNQDAFVDFDLWSFDIFNVVATNGFRVMTPLSMKVFLSHNLFDKFSIPTDVFAQFVMKVERHYKRNPYHNSIHATDVMTTVNCIIVQTGFVGIMTDLEILTILITALVHDVEHTGTNNNFHTNSRSDMAKLYMVSILENHHLRVALGLLRIFNVLASLTETEYEEFKSMLCNLILSTDMSNHFLLLTNMKMLLHGPKKCSSRFRIRRIMMLLLHTADISNPARPWDIHKVWVALLCEEFYDQGDQEKKLNIPVSPNCDRKTSNIAALQIGFTEAFAAETFDVLYGLMEADLKEVGRTINPAKPWVKCMKENALQWKKNWGSLKFEFINKLFDETAKPRKSLMVDNRRTMKKRKKNSLVLLLLLLQGP